MLQPVQVVRDTLKAMRDLDDLVDRVDESVRLLQRMTGIENVPMGLGEVLLGRRRSTKPHLNKPLTKTVSCVNFTNLWRLGDDHYTLSLPTAPKHLTTFHRTKSPGGSLQASKSVFA